MASLAVLAAFFLVGCDYFGGDSDVPPDSTKVAGTSASRLAGKALTNDNWSLALSDADRYAGSPVDLTGQIFNVLGDYDDASHYQLFTDPQERAGNTHLAVPLSAPKLQEGDFVHVVGTLEKMLVVISRGGNELRLPYVTATPVEVNGRALAAPAVASTADISANVTVSVETTAQPTATATILAPVTIAETPTSAAATATATVAATPPPTAATPPPTATSTPAGPFNREYSSADFSPGSAIAWINDASSPTGQYLSSKLSNKEWNGAAPVPANGSSANVTVTIPKAGRYAIWLRMEYQTIDANSVWLMVDNQRAVLFGNEDGGYGVWKWVGWRDGYAGNRVNADLAAGTHTITVVSREGGTRFDRLLMTDDLAFRPSNPASTPTAPAGTPLPAAPTSAPTASTQVPPTASTTAAVVAATTPPATTTPTPAAKATANATQLISPSPTAVPSAQPTSKPSATAVPSPTSTPAPTSTPPATTTRAPNPTPQASSGGYTVQSGDTLSGIAQRLYGDAGQYRRIYDANRDKLSSPDLIQPGQQLRIP